MYMSDLFKELVIVKRSGQRVSFNGTKIAVAIKHAFDNVYEKYNEESVNKIYGEVLKYIEENYKDRKTINVEDIQDIIEKTLKEQKFIDVYKSFNEYRVKRALSREMFDRKQQHKFVKATEKLVLTATDEKNCTPLELLFNFGKTISAEFSKAYLLDSKYVRSHDEGSIYIHDLNYYVLGTTSSCILNLSNILDYENYFDKLINVLLNFKKEQHGEHLIASFDYILENYAIYMFKKFFKKTIKNFLELEGFYEYINFKGIEGVIDKLNTIYVDDTLLDKYLYNTKVKEIFNKSYEYAYLEFRNYLKSNIRKLFLALNSSDFSINNNYGYSISIGACSTKVGNLIQELILEIIDEIDRLENVTLLYKVKNIHLVKISRLISDNKNIKITFLNSVDSKNKIDINNYKTHVEYFSKGEKIIDNIYEKNDIKIGRMIVSRTSMNLVRVALKSGSINEFYINLDKVLELAKNELIQTFEYKASRYRENYKYIFENNYLIDSEKLENNQKIKKIIKNGTLNLCYAGLKECIYVLKNKIDKTITVEDIDLGLDILKYMKNKCDCYSNEHKLNFVLSETYDKNVLKYFERLDKSIYGIIKDVTDKEQYGCFCKIFDNLNIDLKDRFEFENKISKYSNGGYYSEIVLPKNTAYKGIVNIINVAEEYKIGFINIEMGKRE